jgi:hypothetical protein
MPGNYNYNPNLSKPGMGMTPEAPPPMMFQQPANAYNLTYNQPLTQQQPAVSNSMDQSAPTFEGVQKPAMPDPVAVQPPKTTPTQPVVDTGYGGSGAAPNMGNVTNTLNSMQNQAQNPVAPTQPAYTPPAPAYTPPPAATQSQGFNSPAVNGIVPRPEGVADYTRDYTAAPGSMGSVLSTLRGMQQEVSPTNYNLSPDAPLMNQGQQNLVNMGLDPMIARIYGSRG